MVSKKNINLAGALKMDSDYFKATVQMEVPVKSKGSLHSAASASEGEIREVNSLLHNSENHSSAGTGELQRVALANERRGALKAGDELIEEGICAAKGTCAT
jgi:hypothetical protein